MALRLTLSVIALGALLLIAAAPHSEPAFDRALGSIGSTRYQVRFAGQHVGALHNTVQLLRSGDIEIRSRLSTRLTPGKPQEQIKRLVFAGKPPHALRSASFEAVAEQTNTPSVTSFRWNDGELTVTQGSRVRSDATHFDYHLADYLAVELWLADNPEIGSELIAQDLDFDALTTMPQVWQARERNATGYLLGTGALRDATTIQMDASLLPKRFRILDALDVLRVDDDAPLPDLADGMHSRYFHVRVDQPLRKHTELVSLTLRAHASGAPGTPAALAEAWPLMDEAGVLRSPGQIVEPAPKPGEALGASDDYPTHEPALRAIASELKATWPNPDDYARELVAWVHSRLHYEHGAETTNPVETLARGSGDCTEFAYLYATLARINGIPTRTVSGMAYSADPEPGFLVHAWNVIWLDGGWQAVDPTWNQTHVDASHLAFPDDSRAGLRILAQLPQTRFEVLETAYR